MAEALDHAARAALAAYRTARVELTGPGFEPRTGDGWRILGALFAACGHLRQAKRAAAGGRRDA